MRRHLLKLLSLWIVPLLVARALIPAGFMLSVEAGQLQLMFCPSGVAQPMRTPGRMAHADHQGHEGMHHPGMQHAGMHHDGGADEASSMHAAQDHAPCPFSLVASAAPSTLFHLAAGASAPSDERFDFTSALTSHVGPIRTDLIRGPPSLA